MPLLTLVEVEVENEHLVDSINAFRFEIPAVVGDAALLDRCGPIAFAFALYLRANSLPGGLVHVTGAPAGHRNPAGHYLATSARHVIDWAYRQFDPTAPLPVVYLRADLDTTPGAYRPWTGISGELDADDPLYPDFVDYPGCDPLRYVPAHLADPEWVTPIDER